MFVPSSRCLSPVSSRDIRQHWESMAGRGRKGKEPQQPTDAQELCEGGEAERSFIEMFVAAQAKRDEENVERARQERIEAEERAEARRLKAEIAAEEREEKRREREEERREERKEKARIAEAERLATAKLAEEERLEARALAAEKRKREEAMKFDEMNKEKEEAAREAANRLIELQEEAAKKAYVQQKELMEMQAEIGRRASEAHRLEVEKTRKRDRVVSSLTVHQKDEDVEEFLLAQERKLGLGGIPEGEWLTLIAPKLSGGLGTSWQELSDEGLGYKEVRTAWLKGCGYTPSLAGEAYYAFRQEQLKGMAGEQVFKKGAQLLKRMVAPLVLDKAMVFKIVKPWVYSCVGRKARAVLEAREIEDAEALGRGLQDFLSHEGEKVPGKAAVFGGVHSSERRQYHQESERDRGVGGMAGSHGGGSSMKCFRCGKIGHKAVDCWQAGPGKQEEVTSSKIICYICGVEGHKATVCPGKKEAQKGANVKLIQQVRLGKEYDTAVEGKVNGCGATLVLDSGAHVTVVPEDMVAERCKTGEFVELKGYMATTSFSAPTAKVKFQVEGLAEWEEIVALAPTEKERENEVILRLEIRTDRGRRLIELARSLEDAEGEVKGKSEKEGEFGKKENLRIGVVTVVKSAEKESVEPVRPPVGWAVAGRGGGKAVATAGPQVQKAQKKLAGGGAKAVATARPKVQKAQKKVAVNKLEVLSVDKILGTGEGGLTADRPVRNPEPVASDESRLKDEWPDWSGKWIDRSSSVKPVRALQVVMRSSALEHARFGRVKRTSRWEDRAWKPFTEPTSWSSRPAPSAGCGTAEGPGAFTGRRVSFIDALLPTIPTQNKDSSFGGPRREEGTTMDDFEMRERSRSSQPDDRRGERGGGAEATVNDLERRSEADVTGLRAAPFLFVGGDVGTESPQEEGGATRGVAPSRRN